MKEQKLYLRLRAKYANHRTRMNPEVRALLREASEYIEKLERRIRCDRLAVLTAKVSELAEEQGNVRDEVDMLGSRVDDCESEIQHLDSRIDDIDVP